MSRDEPVIKGLKPPRLPSERPGQAGGKRDLNRRLRIQQLCEAALQLFLERGIVAVTIDEIVKQAGVGKASLYRYFQDKEEVVDTIMAPLGLGIRDVLETCEKAIAKAHAVEDFAAAYQALGTGLAVQVLEHPREIRLYLQEARAPGVGARRPVRTLAEEVDERALRLTMAAFEHGLFRPINPKLSTLAVVGATERLLLAVLRGEQAGDLMSIPGQLTTIILDGLRSETDASRSS